MNEQLPLAGMQVVVEDMYMIAMDLCDRLTDCGCSIVGPAASVKQALEKIEGVALDGAVLDVNLDGERSFPIAESLASRGVPFLFLSGYDSATIIPEEFLTVQRLSKPVDIKALTSAIARFRDK